MFLGFCGFYIFFSENMPAQFFKKPWLFLGPGSLNCRCGRTPMHQAKQPIKARIPKDFLGWLSSQLLRETVICC